eukprot:12566452-Alexandrium_andersonii.AAC.1
MFRGAPRATPNAQTREGLRILLRAPMGARSSAIAVLKLGTPRPTGWQVNRDQPVGLSAEG